MCRHRGSKKPRMAVASATLKEKVKSWASVYTEVGLTKCMPPDRLPVGDGPVDERIGAIEIKVSSARLCGVPLLGPSC